MTYLVILMVASAVVILLVMGASVRSPAGGRTPFRSADGHAVWVDDAADCGAGDGDGGGGDGGGGGGE